MAILASVPGIEVTIQSNNQPLVEYEDDNMLETLGEDAVPLGPNTASKYIESITGQEFSIKCTVTTTYNPRSPSLTIRACVDGVFLGGGRVIETPANSLPLAKCVSFKGSSTFVPGTSQESIHHFTFSNIKTSTDDQKLSDIKTDVKRMSKIGMIEIKVHRTSTGTAVPRLAEMVRLGDSKYDVHEKALKGQAKSHGVSSGRTTTEEARSSVNVDYLDGYLSPLANFIFQYRSKEALKQLCIIERTPEPDDIAASPTSEAPKPRVKRERDTIGRNVKAEPPAKRSKYKMTIDLTGDSSDDEGSIIDLL